MPFMHTNIAEGLPRNSRFQVGRANIDNDSTVEQSIGIPWAADPVGSYVYYDCAVGVMLDSGIVVHNRLPQQVGLFADTLAYAATDDPNLDKLAGPGVNISCKDQYQDIVQRMGHARYWFRLWGQAIRIGYRVPIPGIRSIGNIPAIPYDKNPQWAYNAIVPGGNYSGVILWRAQWSLWYTTLKPPTTQDDPSAMVGDPGAHIRGSSRPPTTIQSPYTQADDNAFATP